MGDETARLIVCERTSRWAASLHGSAGLADRCRIHSTRGLRLCREMLEAFPASFVVFELTSDNGEELMLHMSDTVWRFPRSASVVVAARGLRAWRWPLREAGALAYTDSPRALADVARMAVRHLERFAVASVGWRESVWDRLPR